jgi:hypothetical protein
MIEITLNNKVFDILKKYLLIFVNWNYFQIGNLCYNNRVLNIAALKLIINNTIKCLNNSFLPNINNMLTVIGK